MVAGTFVVSLVIFGIGWSRQRRRGFSSGPPPLPATSSMPPVLSPRQVEAPYAPPSTMETGMSPQPSADRKWWHVSSQPFRWFDLILMGFILAIYMLPLLMEPLGMLPEGELKIDAATLLATIMTHSHLSFLLKKVAGRPPSPFF